MCARCAKTVCLNLVTFASRRGAMLFEVEDDSLNRSTRSLRQGGKGGVTNHPFAGPDLVCKAAFTELGLLRMHTKHVHLNNGLPDTSMYVPRHTAWKEEAAQEQESLAERPAKTAADLVGEVLEAKETLWLAASGGPDLSGAEQRAGAVRAAVVASCRTWRRRRIASCSFLKRATS